MSGSSSSEREMGGLVGEPSSSHGMPSHSRDHSRRRFKSMRTYSMPFELGEEELRALLPHPLVPESTAARVVFGRWDDEAVGVHHGVGIYLPARLGTSVGSFLAAMYVDSDRSVIVGRELYGEPKFLGAADFAREDDDIVLSVERLEMRLSLRAHLGEPLTPGPQERRTFNLKGHLAIDGNNTCTTSTITATDWRAEIECLRSGSGELHIEGPSFALGHDGGTARTSGPLTYTEGVMTGRTHVVCTVGDDLAMPFLQSRLGLAQ